MKRDKILYWTFTVLVAGMMLVSAYMYLSQNDALMNTFKSVGIPIYIVTILGTAKLLGALALVLPVPPKIKEWSYAGFTFVFIGAIWTHVATHTPFFMPLLFLIVLGLSYWFWYRTGASVTLVSTNEQASRVKNQPKPIV